ncbi:MAG TPA: hypothetical protein VN786_10255 [Acidimicrobiales bacterium]|nr:hypothetical protein [Acidimicrobiales bacterium]
MRGQRSGRLGPAVTGAEGRSPRPARGGLAEGLSAAAAVVGLSLALAACGGSAPSASVAHIGTTTTAPATGPSGSAPSSGNLSGQLQRFVSCMRHHGVPNFPDLVMSANGSAVAVGPVSINKSSPAVQAARSDCQSILPGGTAPSPTITITTKDQAAYLKAAACMRAHGVPIFPDPVFSGNSVSFPKPPGMNANIANSPTFLRAREICEMLIPPGLPFSKQAEGGK